MARTPFRAIATLSLSLLWGISHAQDSGPYEPDPPDRAARLSYIQGDVTLQPAGEEQWAPAIVNRPLTTGDKLWAEQNARAEIQVGPAAVRIGGDTGFSFLNVDDNTIQMRLTAGVINVSVREPGSGEHIEIDTPNVALSLLQAGNYRVEVNDAGDSTVVKVSEGQAQATAPSNNVVVHAQQVVTFTGVDDVVAQYGTLGAPDEFDSWSLERDRRDESVATSRTAEYVAPDVTGYQDLEDNGSWTSEPEYGYVWTPTHVAVGWAPYSFGRWVWVSPWGWTWIDDARWGYAPFHYGSWAHVRNRWCWVPGPRHVRAVYAPALVGWGGSYGANVAWFPLGPREAYVPGRRFSRHYVDRVNGANMAAVIRTNVASYQNRMVPGSVTAMPRTSFASAGRTVEHRVRFSEQDLARSQSDSAAPQIAPGRESRLGGAIRANVRVPPSSLANRQVVVRRDPPPASERFARRVTPSADLAQRPSDRFARPPVRGSDRPPRAELPRTDSAPPMRSSIREPNTIADRVREVRDRQVNEQQRAALLEQDQQQRSQQQDDGQRQQRDQWQQALREQQQQRARAQRPQESVRQATPRQSERPRVEQPRIEQPRVQQPRVEQPRVEQRSRPESPRPAESKPQPRNHEDGNTRSKRD